MKKIKILLLELGDDLTDHAAWEPAWEQADVVLQEIEDHPGYRIIKTKYDWNFPLQAIVNLEE